MIRWPRRRASAMARVHQRRADAAAAALRIDGERAEEKRRPVEAGRNVPQPHGADDAAVVGRDEGQAGGGQPADAQPLAGLGEAGLAERAVEQGLARGDIGGTFMADRRPWAVPIVGIEG